METRRIDDEAGRSIQSVANDSASLVEIYQLRKTLSGKIRDLLHYSCRKIGTLHVCQ